MNKTEKYDTGKISDQRSYKILVVDDEKIIRSLASKVLQKNGFEIILASNGKQAVDIYLKKSSEIDLIMMDIIMPEMGGQEAAKLIKKRNPEARILYTSGFFLDADFFNNLEPSTESFLHKPFRLKDFLNAVTRALGI